MYLSKVVCITCIFYYKLDLCLKMCKVMIGKSDGFIMICKLISNLLEISLSSPISAVSLHFI